jgi:hypothetical protein
MKKLIVLLLAFAMVGAVSAQVTTKVSLSGSVYLEKDTGGSGTITSTLSPNGNGYDVISFSASDKDGKYGFYARDKNFIDGLALAVDRWYVWSKPFDKTKVTIGSGLGGGDYVVYFNNGWLENFDPNDGFTAAGFQVDYNVSEALKVGAFIPLTGATTVDTVQAVKVGAAYSGETLLVTGQVNLDIPGANNLFNVGFDFTGVENLDVYGWAEYQLDAADMFFGVGGQYKTSLFRVGAEFEGGGLGAFAWDAVLNARYYVTPALFVQVRPELYSSDRVRVRGYLNYTIGSGLGAEVMGGYDSAGTSTTFIHYVRLTYSVSL